MSKINNTAREEFFNKFVGEERTYSSNGDDYDNWLENPPEEVCDWIEEKLAQAKQEVLEEERKRINKVIDEYLGFKVGLNRAEIRVLQCKVEPSKNIMASNNKS